MFFLTKVKKGVAVFDVIRKFGNNWIKSMEEGGECALTTGWKHWEVGK